MNVHPYSRSFLVSFLALICMAAMIFAAPVTGQAIASDSGGQIEMYRLYNPNSGEHFYTGDGNERESLRRTGWRYEGVGWVAPAYSSTPVYRLYNPNAGDHHYTTNATERDNLVAHGWRNENIGWYSSDDNRSYPVYRQYNPNAVAGAHNFTLNGNEESMLVAAGWRAEGLAWYAVGPGYGVPQPVPTPGTGSGSGGATDSGVYYENCAAVRAAGKAPLYQGQPGYRPGLDRDGDGVACE